MNSDERQRLSTVARRLLSGWNERFYGGAFQVMNERRYDAEKATRVLAFAHHTHRLAAAGLQVLENSDAIIAMPTIRTCFESALTAHWIAQSSDGVQAVLERETIRRRVAQDDLRKSDNPVYRTAAENIASTEPLGLDTTSLQQAKRFEQMVKDFDGGAELYVMYRHLCGFSHASGVLSDQYLEFDASSESVGYGLISDPVTSDGAAEVSILACSMLWASSAARLVQKDPAAREGELSEVAQELDTIAVLSLTEKAQARQRTLSGRSGDAGPAEAI
ncbi:DUF5677 domain-containing protein [Rhodococcus aetherivorans]|uniref:DUF5677 domain-containing protein n=1 Tax=Rhodococcus aetherivorans TaxID=191292 RepID=UPI0012608657|nr:DUF5677 domain-containing protein [Rhodococcus aetherivorans]NGP28891.1 hypothetical protein [Rhodococcus aetherivorans]